MKPPRRDMSIADTLSSGGPLAGPVFEDRRSCRVHQLHRVPLSPGARHEELALVVEAEPGDGRRQVPDAMGRLLRHGGAAHVEEVQVAGAGPDGEERRRRVLGGPGEREGLDLGRPRVLRLLPASAGAEVPLIQVALRVGREERVPLVREAGRHAGRAHPQRPDDVPRGHVADQDVPRVAHHAVHVGRVQAWLVRGVRANGERVVSPVQLRGHGDDGEGLAGPDVEAPHLGRLARDEDLVPAGRERRAVDGEALEVVGGHLGVLVAVDVEEPQLLVVPAGEQQLRVGVELQGLDGARALGRAAAGDPHVLHPGDLDLLRLEPAAGGLGHSSRARRHLLLVVAVLGRVCGLLGLVRPAHAAVELGEVGPQALLVLRAGDLRLLHAPAELRQPLAGREVDIERGIVGVGPRVRPGRLPEPAACALGFFPFPCLLLFRGGLGLASADARAQARLALGRRGCAEDERLQLPARGILAGEAGLLILAALAFGHRASWSGSAWCL
eukprot:CAMPEP_0179269458 /NCGR_PEP_ID=MMETSP0797-20121207/30968_1 /TAXON_ID=47934 /ORGANISM="Dinophysis acuminata, Strain DAEP01" /LENGTH=498 /DNA_ID=CAMNT_0020977775 /DNA_START=115 /DNA_END=1607 /DNA_ORIENTATION=+